MVRASGAQGFLRPGSQNIPVLRVTKQDIFTKGSTGGPLNGTPGTPCHHSTSHPGASSHEDTPPRDLSLSHVPTTGISHGECPGSTPSARLALETHRWILLSRLDPHHSPKTHAKISPCSLSCYYQVIGTSCLISLRLSLTSITSQT
jgi:hypothetical protein